VVSFLKKVRGELEVDDTCSISSAIPGDHWDISEEGFKIVLSPEVPEMVRKHLARDVDDFLAEYDLDRSDIDTWIMYTGGPKVLEATAERVAQKSYGTQCERRPISEDEWGLMRPAPQPKSYNSK
jgi:predicted naringenin-chalcone synthase